MGRWAEVEGRWVEVAGRWIEVAGRWAEAAGKWMGALLATGIYDARMVGMGRSLAALSVVDGGERGRNRCFLA